MGNEKARNIYIIDGHAHIYAAYYAPMAPLTSPAGEPTKATYVFTQMLLGLIDRKKPDMVVVAMDSKVPSFRTDIYPEYKAHRPPMPEDMPAQIERIEEILEAMHVPMLRVDSYEADDLIGTLAKKAAAEGIESYICSKDKDFLQLLDEHVNTYDVKKDKATTVEGLMEDTGLTPAQFLDVLALQGDTADNVPGVPDVGPKTALGWIQKYGSLDELTAKAEEIKGKRGESLRKSRDAVKLSKRLVTIDCDAPVELDLEAFRVTEFDRERLRELFSELGFSRLLKQLDMEAKEVAAKPKVKRAAQGMLFEMGEEKAEEAAATVEKDYTLVDTTAKLKDFAKELGRQKVFAVDTETTALAPMEAELVGLSFSWKADEGYYLPVKGPKGSKVLDAADVREAIGGIIADEKVRKVGQNFKYDLIVLENAGFEVRGLYFDTMIASYCLNSARRHGMDSLAEECLGYKTQPISELIGKGKSQITFDKVDVERACYYAAEDADVTWQLYKCFGPQLESEPTLKELFEKVEMPLVAVLARMEMNGVTLDTTMLKEMDDEMSRTLGELTEKIHERAGEVFNIDSPKQLGEVLFDRLGLESVKSGKAGRSTDASVLEQLAEEHPIVPLILEYRQLVKLKNTYVAKLGDLVHPRTNRLHASFNQTVTATGRLSSSDPNLQNIPIRTELGRKIRNAFVPEKEGDVIMSADYSQVELRLLAHFSGDAELRRAFETDQDIHRFVAGQVYGVEPEEVTSDMRAKAKGVNFGIIYGQGPFALAKSLEISVGEAKKFIDDYYSRYASIREFMDGEIAKAKKCGYAETILHRRRAIEGLSSRNHNVRSQAERMAINTVIQGSAADLIKLAMIRIQERIEREGLPIMMLIQVHDELVFEMPGEGAEENAEWIRREMETAIELDVPLKVEPAIGPSWLTEK
ncbi:DNA polymerase I [Anaerohalosphaera lusitana]|uniref:DNA polymerase I n=1 Tax=Anaerohalosphaera lusitana TaxID=1936003 RepID=A0A1U9NJ72_9BACT|nr:DNA polymerase I [Anaerohalosphaera lusitana]AQT67983.1 DNA polymerase I [Anaerohalosphaera lusitana]